MPRGKPSARHSSGIPVPPGAHGTTRITITVPRADALRVTRLLANTLGTAYEFTATDSADSGANASSDSGANPDRDTDSGRACPRCNRKLPVRRKP